MIDPTDDEDKEINATSNEPDEGQDETAGEGKKGKSGSAGSAGGAKFSVSESDETEGQTKRKKGDTGEGDSDSFGRGKAGAGAGGGIRLSAQKTKEVGSVWRELTAQDLIDAVVEFFVELPMRASANCQVVWDRTKANAKSFAIVNWAIEFGSKTVRELAKNRDRVRGAARDSRGVIKRAQPKMGMGMNMKPSGPTGAQ